MKIKMLILFIIISALGPLFLLLSGKVSLHDNYLTASRESANLAPNPDLHQEAIIQVYAARAFNWRGLFASHCWIALKAKNAKNYTVYQVMGWRRFSNLPVVVIEDDIADRIWFNQKPQIILDIRNQAAQDMIAQIDAAARQFPYSENYVLWPGPNSNSFIAYIARKVPQLGLVMPSNAIGKDYLAQDQFFAVAPSNTGYQFSLFGLLGITIAKKEGLEINFLGLVYGFRIWPLRLFLPGW